MFTKCVKIYDSATQFELHIKSLCDQRWVLVNYIYLRKFFGGENAILGVVLLQHTF